VKLHDRHPCEGTEPVIYIGHREYRRPDGTKYASPKWYAEWCFEARHQYMALGTTNKSVALRKAQEICRRIRCGESAPKVFRYAAAELRDDYLQLKRNENRAPKTLEKYTHGLTHWSSWCETTDRSSIVRHGSTDFWDYNGFMIEEGTGDSTRYHRLILIKQAFKWAVGEKHIPENRLAGIKLSRPDSGEQPCFTEAQVAILLAAAKPHEAAMFAFMAHLGLRFGEVRDLKWSDMLWDVGAHGFVVIRRGGSRPDKTKTSKIRRIPMNAALKPHLANIPRKFDRIFTARPSKKHPEGGGPISERRLLKYLKRLCKRCGFENPDQYKLHTFRHAFASMCARNNVAYKYALEWMGHRDSDILDLYYKMYDDVAERAMSTIVYKVPTTPATPGSGTPTTSTDQAA
jgi:integrase